jgi:REP element-mobilizing transposase RayT
MEVSVPINMTVAKAAQLLKGYSSYIIFKEIPNHRLRYPQGHFWGIDFSVRRVSVSSSNVPVASIFFDRKSY